MPPSTHFVPGATSMKTTVMSMLQIPICLPSVEQTAAPAVVQTPFLVARGVPVGSSEVTGALATVFSVVGATASFTSAFTGGFWKLGLPVKAGAATELKLLEGCCAAGAAVVVGSCWAAALEMISVLAGGGGAAADEEEGLLFEPLLPPEHIFEVSGFGKTAS